jgi:hypothetical protein
VIYSEGEGYWTHFAPVVSALLEKRPMPIPYVTSSERDPVLANPPQGLRPFLVGSGIIRTWFFTGLEAGVVLMTMPDLQTFHIKRSASVSQYVYLHHSIVSTHMVYRPAAFDHFDSILCVGPHHVDEIRRRESMLGLPAKELVEHGYGRLDDILAAGPVSALTQASSEPAQVLIAPSWGPDALLERTGGATIAPLLDAGFRVVLRPHPRTSALARPILDAIVKEFGPHPRFRLDQDADSWAALTASNLMVSDWSGAALEFALGLERPVLFVDVPRKVNNPDYESLGIEPLEARVRAELGAVIPEQRVGDIGRAAQDLLNHAEDWTASIRSARARWVFNVGTSGEAAAEYLCSLLP